MSLLRISTPGKPTVLIDQGPAHGQHPPYEVMRRTIDNDRGHVGRNHKPR